MDKCLDCEDVVGVGTIDMGRQQYVGIIIGLRDIQCVVVAVVD